MGNVDVECTLMADGHVQVQRVRLEGRWVAVQQGRQWDDDFGRSVLVMLPDHTIIQLQLSPWSLTWNIVPRPSGRAIA